MINIFSLLIEMFSYPFIQRAVIVGVLISICASLLGVTLVLKRFSMIGDALSHVGFGALAVATAMNAAPLAVAIPVVMVAAFFLLRIKENSLIKGDAALALISSTALAIGVMTISLSTGMNTDVYNYLFGSILSLSTADTVLSIIVAIVVCTMYIALYPRIFAITFDEGFAHASGTKSGLYNTILAMLTALTIVLGMRMMGALLISSLIIFPALTSMRIYKSFKSVVICSVIVSVAGFFIGIISSYLYNIPSGASIVCANLLLFIIFCCVRKIHNG